MNLLGRLFLLTLREDISVPRDEFIEKWNDLGLPKEYIPRPRSLEDSFRKALPKKVTQNNMTWMDYKGDAQLQNYPDAKLKTVLIHVEPGKQQVSIHTGNAAVVFLDNGECKSVALRPLFPEEHAYVEKCKQDFTRLLGIVDGSMARIAIQKLFSRCSTLAYRDGAYLIPAKHLDMAAKIQEMIRFLQMYSVTPSNLKIVDYIDTAEHREDLKDALTEHIQNTADFCLAEAKKVKPDPKQKRRHTRGDTLRAELAGLSNTINVYETLMDTSLSDIRNLHQSLLRSLDEALVKH